VVSEFTATLVSENSVDIRCQIAAHRHPDGRSGPGAEILWIVTDGQLVQEGDLLVEFDGALIRELRDDWQLKVIRSEGELRQVKLQYENKKSLRDTELADTRDKLERLLSMQERLDAAHRAQITSLITEIEYARQGTKVAEIHKRFIEKMARLGLPSGSMDTPEQAKLKHEERLKDLGQAVNELSQLSKFDHLKESEELTASAMSTRRALVQTQHNYETEMQLLTARRDAAQRTLDRERERMEYYETQLASCRVSAPFTGVVQHAVPDGDQEHMDPGTLLRNRQLVMSLHSLDNLRLEATVRSPESRALEPGMPASICFDPERAQPYSGTVTEVGQHATHCDVTIVPQDTPRLLPGSMAEISILVERCQDVLCIPLSAIVQGNSDVYCYAMRNGALEQRPLELGAVGADYAEVIGGLTVGETVVQNATSVEAGSE
jgi:RND family efflux transporter MFP subunit